MNPKIVLVLLAVTSVQCRSQQQDRADSTVLENVYWRLVEVNGKRVSTPEEGREVYMMLTREENQQRLKGHAGCNALGGDYKVDGQTIKFQPITTRMFCESQMEIENLFTQMLTAADSYRTNGKSLELYGGEQLLGRFEARNRD